MQYRKEIDGLRAVAVLPVIFFHAGFPAFSGGFVGVDVFFVISGYLITGILLEEMNQGRFSILRFYERRARRILPALFTVVLLCFPFAWAWMPPDQLRDFAKSVVAVVLFSSNVLFWQESGYFDTVAELKPLLHTWSLAVEEQFYIVFPLFLLAVARFGRVVLLGAILFIALISLLLSEWASRYAPSGNFFLAPTRAWELLAGSTCAIIQMSSSRRPANWLSVAGLALILFSIFYYDERTPFPSAYALAPVVGTALVLLYGSGSTWTARMLSQPLLVGIGLISYSAYLWHQPLFAFARLSPFDTSDTLMLALSLCSLALGFLSWKYVETPFRRRPRSALPTRPAVFATSAVAGAAMIAAGAYVAFTDVAKTRFAYASDFIDYFDKSKPDKGFFKTINIPANYNQDCDFFQQDGASGGEASWLPREIGKTCIQKRGDAPNSVFIWGDSHAQMLYFGLEKALPRTWQILQVASSACPPTTAYASERREYCRLSNETAMDAIRSQKPDAVIVSQASIFDFDDLDTTIGWLRSVGIKTTVVVGPAPRWSMNLPWIIVRNWTTVPQRTWTGFNHKVSRYNSRLGRFVSSYGDDVRYVDIVKQFCNASGCLTYLGDNMRDGITTWDQGHLTPVASKYLSDMALVAAVTGDRAQLQ